MTRDPVLVLSREDCRALVQVLDEHMPGWRDIRHFRYHGGHILRALYDVVSPSILTDPTAFCCDPECDGHVQ